MLGAIIGDIVGSRFEWENLKSKNFELFTDECAFTDDSVMTVAIAQALMSSDSDWSNLGEKTVKWMQFIGRNYPRCGYGAKFRKWVKSPYPKPYNSLGNGAAMRVSPCAYAANSLEEAKRLSLAVTEVTHNHPEGIKGAEATTVAIYMARTGKMIEQIWEVIDREYYPMDFTLDDIRDSYKFDVTCMGSVPQALMAFFESNSFEDAIRNAVSIGGDSDTIAAICGSVAEAYYGIPSECADRAIEYLDRQLTRILLNFSNQFGMEYGFVRWSNLNEAYQTMFSEE